MKRIGTIICLSIMMIMVTASVLPLTGVANAQSKLSVKEIAPKDKETGMALENLGFKVYFNRDVEKKENRKANERLCKITDEKGKEVPSVVIFDPKHKNVMMVLADTQNKKTKIKGETEYTLTIEEGFKGNDGSTMGKYTSSFKTLNPGTSMKISMGMMALMFGGMIFFAAREKKKEQEKDSPKKNTQKKVNPYKVAKETGKSVEEIVAKDEKRKSKEREKAAKERRNYEKEKEEIPNGNMRVSKPRPISTVGLKYKEIPPKNAGKSPKGGKNKSTKKKK